MQGIAKEITSFTDKRQYPGYLIQPVQKSELQTHMENNKTLLEPSVQLSNEPFEITNANIKYIVNNINPVCFLSSKSEVSCKVNSLATGMSFHTSYRLKVGLVVYSCFRVSSFIDFNLHLKALLKYITQSLVTSSNEYLHIFGSFPIDIRIGQVLEVAYKCGLKPGISDEGIVIVHRSTQNFQPAKL